MNNSYTVISFPSLGISWDPIRYFQIGPLQIHLYGLIIAAGMMPPMVLLITNLHKNNTVFILYGRCCPIDTMNYRIDATYLLMRSMPRLSISSFAA